MNEEDRRWFLQEALAAIDHKFAEFTLMNQDRTPQNRTQEDRSLKVDVAEFSGQSLKPEDYIDWETSLDNFFEFRDTPLDKQFKMAKVKLTKLAATWLEKVQRQRLREGKEKLKSWDKLKKKMRRKYVPSKHVFLLEQYSKKRTSQPDAQTNESSVHRSNQQPLSIRNVITTDSSIKTSRIEPKSKSVTPIKDVVCSKCHGHGHFKENCPNNRAFTLAEWDEIRGKDKPKTILVSINGREEEMGTITNDDDPNGTYIQREPGVVTPYVADSKSDKELICPEEEEHRAVEIRKSLHTTLKGKKSVSPPKTKQPVLSMTKKGYEKKKKPAGHCWTVSIKEAKPISKKFSAVSFDSALIDLLVLYRYNSNVHEHAKFKKDQKPVHEKLKKTKVRYQYRAKRGARQNKLMQLGEFARILLKQRRFPHFRKHKLKPKAMGPFHIIIKYGDNSMKLKITEGFGIPLTFKARDLAPYLGDAELRTIPSKEGGNEPYWKGSMMIHTRNKDEEQRNKSYSINETESTTEKEDARLKATTQQVLINNGDQLTLHALPRSANKDLEAMEYENGILVHGTSCLRPRTLLYIMDNLFKPAMKVSQSTGCSEQNRTAQQACSDQRT